MVKPHKGKLYHWHKQYFDREAAKSYYREDPGLGYCIIGYQTESPRLGSYWRTSWVVTHGADGLIETRNSHYQLIGPENVSNS